MTAKSKGRSLLERAGDEASLINEIWLIAGIDAFQRNLMHQVTGRPASEVVDWYLSEHSHMRRFVDRHIEAGTCAEAIAELRSEREKSLPGPLPASRRNTGFEWADSFRAQPAEISARTANEPSAPKPQDPIARPRGPRPAKFLAVLTAMRACDLNDLAQLTEESMRATFGASRDVCRKARAAVLSGAALSDK